MYEIESLGRSPLRCGAVSGEVEKARGVPHIRAFSNTLLIRGTGSTGTLAT